MAETENRDPDPKQKPRRIAIRLTRNLVLHYRKAADGKDTHKHRRSNRAYQFYEKTKDEAWKRPIEAIGVVVVIFYTAFAGYQSCQMRKANDLTQTIVRSTISASLSCAASSSFKRHAASEPLTGAFYVTCNNIGKFAARSVFGRLTLTAKSFPDEKVLYVESWKFGGSEFFILGNDGDAWPFHSSKFSPERERQLITDGKEVIISEIAVSYFDESGGQVSRNFCRVEMNSDALGGSPDGWTTCQTLSAIRQLVESNSAQHH